MTVADMFSFEWTEKEASLMNTFDSVPAYKSVSVQQQLQEHSLRRTVSNPFLQDALSSIGMRQLLPQHPVQQHHGGMIADQLRELHYPSVHMPDLICSDMPYFSGHASVFVPVSDTQKVSPTA